VSLTKREEYKKAALQGMLSCGADQYLRNDRGELVLCNTAEQRVLIAARYADAMIAEDEEFARK
jgi:hypothetical protein